MRFAKILSILYRDFIVYNLVFTFAGFWYLFFYGRMSLPYLFWIKVVGFLVLGLWYYQTRRHRFYFYYNLGYSLKALILYSVSLDSGIALLIYIPTNVLAGN
ncbi:MAG: hypothetical protein RIC35_05325 [Marinoscillum sp.]